jgi:hypothetical protein
MVLEKFSAHSFQGTISLPKDRCTRNGKNIFKTQHMKMVKGELEPNSANFSTMLRACLEYD